MVIHTLQSDSHLKRYGSKLTCVVIKATFSSLVDAKNKPEMNLMSDMIIKPLMTEPVYYVFKGFKAF